MPCPVLAAQDRIELEWMIEIFKRLAPFRVMEIGSLYGGTLWHFINNLKPGSIAVSLDWNIYTKEDKVSNIKKWRKEWHGWAKEAGVALRTIYGDSREPETIAKAMRYSPYDFIFVDGGHLYEIVDSDFRNYYPMLRRGGLMAFHDITGGGPRSQPVAQWWQDVIVPKFPDRREIHNTNEIFGIGIITKQ